MLQRTVLAAPDMDGLRHLLPGGEPVLGHCASGPRQDAHYPVAETLLIGNERAYLNECIDTNWISSLGPFVKRFEDAFAREAGCAYGIACANGTVALHLALAALGLKAGDEVIVPTFTMIATANAVRYTGASVKLVDAEPGHFNIDCDLIEAAITPNTRAIVVVHTYGHAADMARLRAIATERNIVLVEDAAESHGAEYQGKRIGGLGDISAFSFYANKVITTGEGGMVCTNNAELAAVVRKLRDHAFSTERHFWHEYVGFNYRMTNLQAAVGLAQVERMSKIVEARRALAGWYGAGLGDIAGVRLPAEPAGTRSVYWMYGLLLDPAKACSRDHLRSELAKRGIETRTFFIPIHLQPIYFDQFRGQRFPVAESLCANGLYLPTSEAISEADAGWISQQIRDIVAGSAA